MSMDIKEAVVRMRDELAPHLSEFSLEMLDVVIADGEWDIAHAMAVESAEYHGILLSTELLQAA